MKKSNIIFIVIDTLRNDFSYKIGKKLSLNDFISYKNIIAPSSWTTPTHASIFTGLYPILHDTHETILKKDFRIKLSSKYNLITNIFNEYGYSSNLFSANPYIRPEFGFRGFHNFYEVPFNHSFSLLSNNEKRIFDLIKGENTESIELIKKLIVKGEFNLSVKFGLESMLKKPYTYLNSLITKWPKDKGASIINELIRNNVFLDNRPQFLFINLMEVHEPYYLKDTITEDFSSNLKNNYIDYKKTSKWRRKYYDEVEYIYKKLSELITILKEKYMFENSLIIITSDHGQLLGEHNRLWHGLFLYNELIDVPLWIKYPKGSSIKIRDLSDKYISHVNFKQFLFDFVTNSLKDDKILYSDTVFSESYGLTTSRNLSKLNEKEKKHFEKYKIAVYKQGMKCIFNITDWKIENITEDCNENIPIAGKEEIFKKEIVNFLKKRQLVPNLNNVKNTSSHIFF